ncbi:MAG: RuBisCO large subunit C-terminal-like domain-containing protein [Treponemataceae bacterium]
MFFDLPFDLPSSIAEGDYVVATYLAFGLSDGIALKKAGQFAIGQSVGTWIALPGVSREMVEDWQARVLAVYPITSEDNKAILRVAFPRHNFSNCFAMMLTALVGNDVSTALRLKLIDLEFTQAALKSFQGPRQGVEGFRSATGVYGRPLILNMIKPCIGHSPEQGAELFYQSGLGGVDLIKDDEVLGDTSVSGVAPRLKAYHAAACKLKEEKGKAPVYIVNITDTPRRMREHARVAISEGGKAVMVNFIGTGLDAFKELTEEYGEKLCFLGHYAGFGIMNAPNQGISGAVGLGILPRLAGADSVMTMYAEEDNSAGMLEFHQTVQKQKLPFGTIRPIMTSIGGGVTPASLPRIIKDFGQDIIIGVGGAIQGHPMGTTSGAKAVMDALAAVMKNETLSDASTKSPELKVALELWGKSN